MRRHLTVNVIGIQKQPDLTGLFDDDNGNAVSDAEARKYLKECEAKGWRVIPCGDCDNFDYKTGCKGHLD